MPLVSNSHAHPYEQAGGGYVANALATPYEAQLSLGAHNVTLLWTYARFGNIDTFTLVQNDEDTTHAADFAGYRVDVYTGTSFGSLTLRRSVFPILVESFTYYETDNISDSGGAGFQRFMRFDVFIKDTHGNTSVVKTAFVNVVR